eukprot:scpid84903/ scgid18239/ 
MRLNKRRSKNRMPGPEAGGQRRSTSPKAAHSFLDRSQPVQQVSSFRQLMSDLISLSAIVLVGYFLVKYHLNTVSTTKTQHQLSIENLTDFYELAQSSQRQTLEAQCKQKADEAAKEHESNVKSAVDPAVQKAKKRFDEELAYQVGKGMRDCDLNKTLAKRAHDFQLNIIKKEDEENKARTAKELADLHALIKAKMTCAEHLKASAWCALTAVTGGTIPGITCEL